MGAIPTKGTSLLNCHGVKVHRRGGVPGYLQSAFSETFL